MNTITSTHCTCPMMVFDYQIKLFAQRVVICRKKVCICVARDYTLCSEMQSYVNSQYNYNRARILDWTILRFEVFNLTITISMKITTCLLRGTIGLITSCKKNPEKIDSSWKSAMVFESVKLPTLRQHNSTQKASIRKFLEPKCFSQWVLSNEL